MPVLDAPAAIEILIGSETGARWRDIVLSGDESLHAPHLIDVEVSSGLRRLALTRAPLAFRAATALDDFRDLRLVRHGHQILLPRIWALRHNLSAYDASYVALAEMLGMPLLTGDALLSRAQGHSAKIVLLQ